MTNANNLHVCGYNYIYDPSYHEMLRLTPGYLCADSINKTLDSLQSNLETITKEQMVNIKVNLERLLANIYDLKDRDSAQSCSLANLYCGITAKLKNLYDSERNAFTRAVNEMNEEDQVTFQKLLREMGINLQ